MLSNEVRQKAKDHIESGKIAESEEDINSAIRHYETALEYKYPDPVPYQRLMILYRKEKNYKEELRVIKAGLDAIINDINDRKQQNFSTRNLRKVRELSNAFMKSAGSKNNKKEITYYPEPVPTWMKRKEMVEKKLKEKKN